MLETIHLALPAATDDLRKLQIGTVAYLSGRIFTARDGTLVGALARGEHAAPEVDDRAKLQLAQILRARRQIEMKGL